MEAERRMQETKELTEELLDHHIDDWVGLMADEHRKSVQLDKNLTQMLTLIAGFEDSIALNNKEEMELHDPWQIP